jgi:mitotic spindle assembly checkpoint protein MAD2
MTLAVQKLVLVLASTETQQVLERWQFDVKLESEDKENNVNSIKDIQSSIQAIIRQITASVTFLPLIEEPCKLFVI